MIVVDTSAVVDALAGRAPDAALVERLAADGDLHAPHLVDVEFLHVLRRLVWGGDLSEERASDARDSFAALTLERYPHDALADRIWALRADLTPYDAAFVVLAEVLGAALVTLDGRIARAPGHYARVEVYGVG